MTIINLLGDAGQDQHQGVQVPFTIPLPCFVTAAGLAYFWSLSSLRLETLGGKC